MKKRWVILCIVSAAVLFAGAFFLLKAQFRRPYRDVVEASGVNAHLVYSVMKAESGFDERALSRAGAMGMMQLLPSTARFVCEREEIEYREDRLFEGKYNVKIGTLYLKYLLEKFPATETALAAYNAGEGVVSDWLKDKSCSPDGITLSRIPYGETENYLKKVLRFLKFYDFFY